MSLHKFNKQVATSADEFSRQLMQVMAFVSGDVNQIMRKVLLDLWSEIVETTPRDTGRARRNWSIETELHQEEFTENREYDPHATFTMTKDTKGVWIFNNLEYIIPLEEGHSRQRPNGFVALALQKFQRHLESEARKAGYIT